MFVLCLDVNMERKVTWRTEGFKQYKNGSKREKPRTGKKKSHRGHGCLSVVSVVCCQVEVSATGWSLVQRSPTECGVSECDREAWKIEAALAPKGLSSYWKKTYLFKLFGQITVELTKKNSFYCGHHLMLLTPAMWWVVAFNYVTWSCVYKS
jgi:hypothetical protein